MLQLNKNFSYFKRSRVWYARCWGP